ncbi:carbohydrate kinase family protein [Spiroplasma alleghenense]|uniref:Fructokinase n=1 Tax=Spiroplasma alleghenense TaxID=216931 RepID=A0A345Z5A5_9MOLU|nr:carbohydrate kinase [Spiroplasma alleghenense]AXK51784.1 fructokinase [Spiroplasma alleghenense]
MANKILCIGEALVDIYQVNDSYKVNPGGAPFNVACSLGRLESEVYFYGAIGDDDYGKIILDNLELHKVENDFVQILNSQKTTQALVSLDKNGERNFEFISGADQYLEPTNFDEKFSKVNLVHFGSATGLMEGELFKAYQNLLKWSLEKNLKISFDPNFRDKLWNGKETEFETKALNFFKVADFVKFSEEELDMLFEGDDLNAKLINANKLNPKALICVTLGEKGTKYIYKNQLKNIESTSVKAVDTTGAGDAFAAMMLNQLNKSQNWEKLDFNEIVRVANQFACQAVKHQGALTFLNHLGE